MGPAVTRGLGPPGSMRVVMGENLLLGGGRPHAPPVASRAALKLTADGNGPGTALHGRDDAHLDLLDEVGPDEFLFGAHEPCQRDESACELTDAVNGEEGDDLD